MHRGCDEWKNDEYRLGVSRLKLPQPLQEFIGQNIDSIETLEILLLLHRSPETYWMAPAIESHLGIKAGTADKRLQGLMNGGFIVKGTTGAYRYSPENEEQNASVSELATAYAEKRVAVVNAVFSENLARLRAFSNAFRVKSE
jgi:predicted transcriptional regulator